VPAVVTATYPLAETAQAFGTAEARTGMKVVVTPDR
jgi:hypothetical protein